MAVEQLGLGKDRAQPGAISHGRVLEGIDERQGLLVLGQVGRLLAHRLLIAPDAQQVVIELEGHAQRPAEAAICVDDALVFGRQHGSGLDRCRDQRRRLTSDHVEVEIDRQTLVMLGTPDVHELALAQGEAGLVIEAHQSQHTAVAEAELGQAMESHAREREERVAGVDRLGDAEHGPQRGSMATLHVAVLDVIVDEAEVVAQLDRRGSGQCGAVVTGQRFVGEQPEEGTKALAARALAVEAEVVAHHLVQRRRPFVLGSVDDRQDLVFGIGNELVDIRRGEHGRRIQAGGLRDFIHQLHDTRR